MNKTERVAWHKHLKRKHREEDRRRVARTSITSRGAARPGSSGVHAPPAGARQAGAGRPATTSRPATPRPTPAPRPAPES